MSQRLTRQVPGVAFGFTQPIEMRVDELVAGVKADVAVLLYGDDMDLLGQKGKEIERVLRTIPGAVDVKADYQANIPTLTITAQPEQLARYGIEAVDVMDTVSSIGGHAGRTDLRRTSPLSTDGSPARNLASKTRSCWSEFRSSRSMVSRSRWESLLGNPSRGIAAGH